MVKAPLTGSRRKRRSLNKRDNSAAMLLRRTRRAASRDEVLVISASSGRPGSRSSTVEVTIEITAIEGSTDSSTSGPTGTVSMLIVSASLCAGSTIHPQKAYQASFPSC